MPPEGKPPSSFLLRHAGRSLAEFTALAPAERASAARDAVADLHFFLDEGRSVAERQAPERTVELARGIYATLSNGTASNGTGDRELEQRIVTDALLREECDRDQNVYLSTLFTRRMTNAVPDVVFQPVDGGEVSTVLRWARSSGVAVTLRGAATTAMGGAVPADGGLVLDLSRLDAIEVDAPRRRVRFGAGTRMRPLHRELAARELALPVYPSNLGGTYAGWFATGGIGMNAYGRGRAVDPVLAAEVVLPGGEWLRLGADHTLEVLGLEPRALASEEREAWFRAHGYPIFGLADLAGSEGQFGVVTALEVALEPLPDLAPFLLAFEGRAEALLAFTWFEERIGDELHKPADVKLLSASHMRHAREVWREEDGRHWRSGESTLAGDAQLPWRSIVAPADLGVSPADLGEAGREGGAYLFVDFLSVAQGREFARLVSRLPGAPRVLAAESVRLARDRFRPQQIKRLGPGLIAAEILLPSKLVDSFVPAAETLGRRAGRELDAEVYFLSDRTALCIAGYLVDHRSGAFRWDLVLAPQLLDLAMSRFSGEPYVLGRWQAVWFARKFAPPQRRYLASLKASLDPGRLLNPGSFFEPGLRGLLGGALRRTMAPTIRALRWMTSVAPPLARGMRAFFSLTPGPAADRGFAADEMPLRAAAADPRTATGRAITCVNCGECNSVCPVFHESKVRLPQMLTHLGEGVHAGESLGKSGSALLDLCMRCGNCEEVCQAGIPHLPLYAALQQASDAERPRDRERHVLLLERLRASPRYTSDFLGVRPGGYAVRVPAALPGQARFVLLRAQEDEGPANTCIHCAACVDVCPTSANREYEGDDPRWITTLQERCIGCGTCVEVCPANHANGGRTLRVMEAPTLDWFAAAREFAEAEREER